MRCEEAREMLAAYASGDDVSLTLRRHLEGCRGCRAELARYESMLTDLRSLKAVTADPPPGLKSSLIAIPSTATRLAAARTHVETAKSHVSRHRKVYMGGLAVAVAGAVGAAAWRTRVRAAAA
jgi:hypothetical protein